MAGGFGVDIDALDRGGRQLLATAADVLGRVRSLDATTACGNDPLTDAMGRFADRWGYGLETLVGELTDLGEGARASARSYDAIDFAIGTSMMRPR